MGKAHKHRWSRIASTGVYRCRCGIFRIRVTRKDPQTGKPKDMQRTLPQGITLGQAVDLRDEIKAEVDASGPTQPGRRQTLRDYSELWIEVKAAEVKQSTARLYVKILALHIYPALGDLYLDTIRRIDVQRLINSWARKCSESTVRTRATALLFPLLKDAAADHDLPDPTRRVRVWGKPSKLKQRALSADEVEALLKAVTDPQRRAECETLLWTGIRIGELCALQWDDVDLPAGIITVQRRVLHGEIDTPKGGKTRLVPIPERLAQVLQEHRKRLITMQHPGLPSGLVFPSKKGGFRGDGGLRDLLRKLARQLEMGRVTPHTFRHTYTTRLREVAPDYVVQAIVGHANTATTDHYTHTSAEVLAGAVGRLAVVNLGPEPGT